MYILWAFLMCCYFLSIAPPVLPNVSLPLNLFFRPCASNSVKNNFIATKVFSEVNAWGMFQLHLHSLGNNSICFNPIYNSVPGRAIISSDHLCEIQIASQLPPHLLLSVTRHEVGHCLGLGDSHDNTEASIMALVVGEPTPGTYKEIPAALWYSVRDVESIRHNFFLQSWSDDLVVPCV